MQLKGNKAGQYIYETLKKAGYQAYYVGGCVRDTLLNRPVNDYDMTTDATPDESMALLIEARIIPTGIRHGTITVIYEHECVELTTFRANETYLNHRQPDSLTFVSSLNEDLKRRDFTINALVYNPDEGFLDLNNGMTDLENHMIRCIGNPKKRFEEDALRVIRAFRFAHQLNFTIEKNTLDAAIWALPALAHISKERIRDEFFKMLTDGNPNLLPFLRKHQILDTILPEITPLYDLNQHSLWHDYDAFTHTALSLDAIENTLEMKLAMLFHDIGKAETMYIDANHHGHFPKHALVSEEIAKKVLRRYNCSNQLISKVCLLIHEHDHYMSPNLVKIRHWLLKLDNDIETAKQILRFQLADNASKNQDKIEEENNKIRQVYQLIETIDPTSLISLKTLAINGSDCLAAGYQGKEIKEILNKCLYLVMDNPKLNTKEKLIEYIDKKRWP